MTHMYIKPYTSWSLHPLCVRVNVYVCKYYVYIWYMVERGSTTH